MHIISFEEKEISEIIIGISSIKDIKELIENKDKYKLNLINKINPPILSYKLLDPRLWPKINLYSF